MSLQITGWTFCANNVQKPHVGKKAYRGGTEIERYKDQSGEISVAALNLLDRYVVFLSITVAEPDGRD